LRQFLWAAPELALGGGDCDDVVECGPLSLVAVRNGTAALVRLVPRFPGQTELELVEMTRPDNNRTGGNGADPLADALAGDGTAAAPLDRGFYDWYWAQMAPAAAA